jgi:hypothetical protein
MGRHGRPAMTRRQLETAYREACTERRRLRDQLHEVIQDNIRMSGRLSEIDLGMYRMDLNIQSAYREACEETLAQEPVDQGTEELPAPATPTVDLVKRPKYRGISSVEAVADMRSFMIRIHEAAGDTTAVQELRIL